MIAVFPKQAPATVPQESFASPVVQRTGLWRKDVQMEKDAGFTHKAGLTDSFFQCALCGIYIGYNHLEQDVYLYPCAKGQVVCMEDDYMVMAANTTLEICGSCARDSRRNLPDSLWIITYQHWRTRLLLDETDDAALREIDYTDAHEVFRLRLALRRHVDLFHIWLRLLSFYAPTARRLHLSLAYIQPLFRAFANRYDRDWAKTHAQYEASHASSFASPVAHSTQQVILRFPRRREKKQEGVA